MAREKIRMFRTRQGYCMQWQEVAQIMEDYG